MNREKIKYFYKHIDPKILNVICCIVLFCFDIAVSTSFWLVYGLFSMIYFREGAGSFMYTRTNAIIGQSIAIGLPTTISLIIAIKSFQKRNKGLAIACIISWIMFLALLGAELFNL